MPISKANLSKADQDQLLNHLRKHKIYPFRYRFNKTVNATNFATLDGTIGNYFTMRFNPTEILGIVSLATQFIINPNTTVGQFSLILSYNSIITMADSADPNKPDDEANIAYCLTSNGGAINDFEVFYPLNWFVESAKPIYMHVWADRASVTAGTSAIIGHFVFGTLLTGTK